jgi:diguanylate cyclase (GGDEF)-like protein
MPPDPRLTILVIEVHPTDARRLKEALARVKGAPFAVECADRLSLGLKRLAGGRIDAVLLDLDLPDSQGLDTFVKVHVQCPEVPIVVLSRAEDETQALEVIQLGAQDCLVTGQLDPALLARAVRYAIARHQTQEALRGLSLIDDLTGLSNRRGFVILAQQQLKLAKRTRQPLLLFLFDLDHLKVINDTWGHHEGNLALVETATLLSGTFRESDVIARLGGDEFTVLAINAAAEHVPLLTERLQANLQRRNAQPDRRYQLSLSLGVAAYDPARPASIEELLAQADAALYAQKRGRRPPGAPPPAPKGRTDR